MLEVNSIVIGMKNEFDELLSRLDPSEERI